MDHFIVGGDYGMSTIIRPFEEGMSTIFLRLIGNRVKIIKHENPKSYSLLNEVEKNKNKKNI